MPLQPESLAYHYHLSIPLQVSGLVGGWLGRWVEEEGGGEEEQEEEEEEES